MISEKQAQSLTAMCHSKESFPVVLLLVVEMLNPSDEFGGVVL